MNKLPLIQTGQGDYVRRVYPSRTRTVLRRIFEVGRLNGHMAAFGISLEWARCRSRYGFLQLRIDLLSRYVAIGFEKLKVTVHT